MFAESGTNMSKQNKEFDLYACVVEYWSYFALRAWTPVINIVMLVGIKWF
jgi:hypothetical protein